MNIKLTENQINKVINEIEQELNELAWEGDIDKFVSMRLVPLTNETSRIINDGKKRIRVFHMSDINNIDNLKSIIGTRKSISSATYFNEFILKYMSGIRTEGGLLYYLEGDLQYEGSRDIMSRPDKVGRRWVSIEDFPDNFANDVDKIFNNDDRLNELYNIKDDKLKYSLINKYIRNVYELMHKHIGEIRKHFRTEKTFDTGQWNEILVNNIKIIDVLWKLPYGNILEGFVPEEYVIEFRKLYNKKIAEISAQYPNEVAPRGVVEKFYKWEEKEKLKFVEIGTDVLLKKLRSVVSGSIDYAKKESEIFEWVKSRGGYTDSDEYRKMMIKY